MRIIVVTGLSGAGASTVLRALEDVDFYCVDNLPLPLIHELVDTMAGLGVENVALSIDGRQKASLSGFDERRKKLEAAGHKVEILFLEAPNDVLLRRYSTTRRRHPLSGDDVRQGIRTDREILGPLRDGANVVDTGPLTVHQLRGYIHERYASREGGLAITLLSFGFKRGVPRESDLVFDVRFLPNPYFVPELSAKHGKQREVANYVLETEEGREAVARIEDYVRFSLPRFEAEGKMYLTVSIGCTGGRHRSVAIVEELSRRLGEDWDLATRHRDLREDK